VSVATLLVDTRGRPAHCHFLAFLRGDQASGVVRVSKCCDQCLKALRITLRLSGMGHLQIRRD
jgi:hypothetical protein